MFNINKEKIKEFILENKFILLLFFISTIFFIWQNINSFSWDFQSFVLNANYLYSNGNYFELLRPPLPSLLLYLFSFAGWFMSEILFVIFVNFLFFYGIYKLSTKLNINNNLFYTLNFTFIFFSYAIINGTELLSIALFILFLVFLIDNSIFAGLFIALASLTRYSFLPYSIFLLWQNSFKKIIKSLILFGVILSPWFIYNYIFSGNFFTSIADQYANNILFRWYLMKPFDYVDFLIVVNILIIPFIIGLLIEVFSKNTKQFLIYLKSQSINLIKIKKIKKMKINFDLKKIKVTFLMFLLFILSLKSYNDVPLKHIRYLFSIILPLAYFSTIGFDHLLSKLSKINFKKYLLNLSWYKLGVLLLCILIFSLNLFVVIKFHYNDNYLEKEMLDAKEILIEYNLLNCQVKSNAWVPLNYVGIDSHFLTRSKTTDINSGNVVLYFNYARDPEDNFEEFDEIKKFILYNDSNMYLFSNGVCLEKSDCDTTYLQGLKEYKELYEVDEFNINPCYILFNKFDFIEGTCNFINFNGFIYDTTPIQ
jgi:hypothetical protein